MFACSGLVFVCPTVCQWASCVSVLSPCDWADERTGRCTKYCRAREIKTERRCFFNSQQPKRPSRGARGAPLRGADASIDGFGGCYHCYERGERSWCFVQLAVVRVISLQSARSGNANSAAWACRKRHRRTDTSDTPRKRPSCVLHPLHSQHATCGAPRWRWQR